MPLTWGFNSAFGYGTDSTSSRLSARPEATTSRTNVLLVSTEYTLLGNDTDCHQMDTPTFQMLNHNDLVIGLCCRASATRQSLFHGHALGQIAGLIDIVALENRGVISQELHWNGVKNGCYKRFDVWQFDRCHGLAA